MQPEIGLMVLCHKRHQVLPLIVEQVQTVWPGARVDFTLDRPSPEVQETVDQLVANGGCRVFPAPFPALTHREQFIELRQFQLEKIQAEGVKWISMWDDDHILERPEELRDALAADQADLFYISKRYFWDDLDHINEELPRHHSIIAFRNVPAQRWKKMVMAPHPLHDTGRRADLAGGLLDVGYMAPAERARVWA